MSKCAVIVTYNPVESALKSLCNNLINENVMVILIDNSDISKPSVVENLESEKCYVQILGENLGIAAAQNIGIKVALSMDIDFIYLFDQDSIINQNLLESLATPLDPNKANVSAPVCYDEVSDSELPVQLVSSLGHIQKRFIKDLYPPYNVDLVISSGMLITAETFNKVGLLDEDFFIDFVDFEWCFRCKSLQIPIYLVPNTKMKHSIGLGSSKVLFGGSIHNPMRSYYKVRNCFLLFRKKHVPLFYSLRLLAQMYYQQFIAVISQKDKVGYLNSIILATYDGLRGKFGKKK